MSAEHLTDPEGDSAGERAANDSLRRGTNEGLNTSAGSDGFGRDDDPHGAPPGGRPAVQTAQTGDPAPPDANGARGGGNNDNGVEGTALGADDPPELLLAAGEEGALDDARGAIRSGKLAGKTMWAAIWILALPVLLQQAMAALVGMVDKMMAGNLPQGVVVPALDAIGVGSYVGWLIGICMTGLGIGAQAIIARAIGRGDGPEAHIALRQALGLSVLWGAMVGVAMWLLAEPLGHYTSLSPEAITFCTQYVSMLALAMPFCGIMLVGSMCLHGAGETTMPSMIAIAVNVVNIFSSWALSGVVLRFGEFSVPNLFPIDPATGGVLGIAGGTALSYAVGAGLTLWVMRRGVKDLRLEFEGARIRPAMIRRIVRLGVPNFAEGMAMWGVNLFVMRFIGMVAAAGAADGEVRQGLIGAHVIAIQWEAFSFLPGFAMGTAAGALAGQYLGAGHPLMARRAIEACTLVGAAIMGTFGIVFMTAGDTLTQIISDDPLYLRYTPNLLFICGSVQVFFALTMVVRQGLRGVGDVRWTLLITVVSSYFVRLPLAYLLGVSLGYGLEGIWFGLCGELVIRGAMFAGRFASSGWERVRV